MIGRQYGSLTIIARGRIHKQGWECRCSCGRLITTSGRFLRTARVISCTRSGGRCIEEVKQQPPPSAVERKERQRQRLNREREVAELAYAEHEDEQKRKAAATARLQKESDKALRKQKRIDARALTREPICTVVHKTDGSVETIWHIKK